MFLGVRSTFFFFFFFFLADVKGVCVEETEKVTQSSTTTKSTEKNRKTKDKVRFILLSTYSTN